MINDCILKFHFLSIYAFLAYIHGFSGPPSSKFTSRMIISKLTQIKINNIHLANECIVTPLRPAGIPSDTNLD